MSGKIRINVVIAASLALAGCGGSESAATTDSIKLSGPLTQAAVASDATTTGGTVAISDTMASFPAGVLEDFATRFPSVVAEEQYRRITYSGGAVVDEVFGIEGESPDDDETASGAESDNASVEISADYSGAGNFLASVSNIEDAPAPAAVTDALAVLYPGTSIDDIEQHTDQNGTVTYLVEIEQVESEREITLDSTGNLLQTTEEVAASQVPSIVLTKVQQELTGISNVEYELVTDNITGTVTYEAEFEGQNESVSIVCSDAGEIVAIEYEVDLY